MKHLSIVEHGQFVGLTGNRLTVSKGKERLQEYPLNRLKTVVIAKTGVSLSSNIILACAVRGIKIFFHDFKGEPVAGLSGTHSHAVAKVREHQFAFCGAPDAALLAGKIIYGKIRNQRAVLNYFSKYLRKEASGRAQLLIEAAEQLKACAKQTQSPRVHLHEWRNFLLGVEGSAANIYWHALANAKLLPEQFLLRTGRGASDLPNKALNYGYSILMTHIWNAIINAGLEPYAGFLHVQRPGKASLVLDLMEEYRPWVVDRVIIKKRNALAANDGALSIQLKKDLIADIHGTFARNYQYRKRRMSLESILQRQVYLIAAHFMQKRNYRPYLFRW